MHYLECLKYNVLIMARLCDPYTTRKATGGARLLATD
jgi:hypothetical protein